MSDVKVNVIHPKVYDAKGKALKEGLQSMGSELAEKLIKRGVAKAEEEKEKEKEKTKKDK